MDVFLMIRRHNLTIFLDAKENTTIRQLKKIVEGITKRPVAEQLWIKDDQVLHDNKTLADYNLNSVTTKAQSPATIGLCYALENGTFEQLEFAPLSLPPELPDAMKPPEGQTIEQNSSCMN